ncbi:MAG: hypothetical protein P4N24_16930 [Acidobacteriota bacterium]|nr:hypothetical protein [Acidobacteriota bacterium]
MKRWAVLVVIFYFLILVALTSPLFLVAFYPSSNAHDAISVMFEWMYWAGLGVMVLAQAAMLVVPVELSVGRPTAQRSVLWTILASGLMVGVLGAGAAISIDEFLRREKAGTGDAILPWAALLVLWAAWSLVFYRSGRGAAAMDVVTRQCRFLLKGSILELLVAVPTHIVARARDYCCAGVMTFLGIAFGVAVMLFSFGPGVFFLFAARWKRLHPQAAKVG